MKELIVEIPIWDAEQNIEIDVRVNGKKRTFRYRVEIVNLGTEDAETIDRVSIIKRVIEEYDRDWRLFQIGMPTKKDIPIIFQKKQVNSH
ncbi:MAG: hypothetical protein JSV96_09980 [Candidatus Aminicenantes bacterium]|nr:MAG: hypothetical protein JSV96_09980 [Candidatus Aminicenantes bacterium]